MNWFLYDSNCYWKRAILILVQPSKIRSFLNYVSQYNSKYTNHGYTSLTETEQQLLGNIQLEKDNQLLFCQCFRKPANNSKSKGLICKNCAFSLIGVVCQQVICDSRNCFYEHFQDNALKSRFLYSFPFILFCVVTFAIERLPSPGRIHFLLQ